ncbi:MAG: DUF2974 domain-containing protein [Oscillatoria sp. SIO1A7]|nr:DUF2974 domain-containing protein [Oscillatoria sp. SIO1A7]
MRGEKLKATKTRAGGQATKASPSAKPAPHPVLQLQADIGNGATNSILKKQGRQNASPGLLIQGKPMFGGLSGELLGESPIQTKLTLGAVGDKYEQEADRVAAEVTSRLNGPSREVAPEGQQAAPVQRKIAPSPMQAKEGGTAQYKHQLQVKPQIEIPYIQRALVDENAASKINSLDAVYELIAHKLAYKAKGGMSQDQGDWLESQGYKRNWEGTVKGSGLFCGLLMPREENSDKKPVLAFKGTDPKKLGDVKADFNLKAVGFDAFHDNKEKIEDLINKAGEEKVDVTGHSLGGALAQHAGAAFPSKIRRLVTFQAPGITQKQARGYNKGEDKIEEIVHHIAKGDIVDLAGGKHLGGKIAGKGNAKFYVHDIGQKWPHKSHTMFLLQDEANEALGLEPKQIGKRRKVEEYNNSPFPHKQFAGESTRTLAGPGFTLAVGGTKMLTSGWEDFNSGKGWKRFKGVAKGVGKMSVGGLGLAGGLAGGLAVGVPALLAGGTAAGTAKAGQKVYEGGQVTAAATAKAGKKVYEGGQATAAATAKAGKKAYNKSREIVEVMKIIKDWEKTRNDA